MIIDWLQKETGEHVKVYYTLYDLAAENKGRHSYPTLRASFSDLLLLNQDIKQIVLNDAWYLPESPEFEYKCLMKIRGFQIEGEHYELQRRRIL